MRTRSLHLSAFILVIVLASCSSGTERSASGSRASASQAARLDSTRVPAELRSLTPLAAEWGIGDDEERAQRVARSTAEERVALRAAVLPHDQRLTAWLDTFGDGAEMSNEAAAFMYMRLAIEEMPEDR